MGYTFLYFLKGYSNSPVSRELPRSSMTQKKPAVQRILNTPMRQTPCIAGFLNRQNKRIDHSIESLLWSIRGGERGIRTLDTVPRIHDFQSCALDQLSHLSIRCSTRFLSYTITVHFARLFSPFRMKRLYVRFQIPRVSFLSVVRSALRYSVGATPQCCLKKAENALSLINPARSEISATVRSAYFR